MPAQPAWFHRFDEILETLRGMESSHLDRLAVHGGHHVVNVTPKGELLSGARPDMMLWFRGKQ